jgi:trimethylamine---corrinoid protein Co-methyltransferase
MKRFSHPSLAAGSQLGLGLLGDGDCEKIHEASIEVLQERGMFFGSEKARAVLRDNGCWEDSEGCMHFPRKLVEDAMDATPSEFIHRGRTPDDDLSIARDQVYASNFGEGICTYDLRTRERRATVKQDAVDILRVVDSLDNIQIYNRAIGPQDVPNETASLHNAELAFCYTSKPKHLVSGTPFQTKKMIKMAEIMAGGKEELKRRPPCAFNHTTISPLRIAEEACENAMLVAEAGLPNHILVMVQQGATSPISPAGSMVVNNSDFMGFNTLLQCVNRGNPTMYGASACTMDMKTGLSLVAAPEAFMLNAGAARMSKFYNIPSYIAGG